MKMRFDVMLIVGLAAAGTARAQEAGDMGITVRGFHALTDGGDKSNVAFGTGRISIGRTDTGYFSTWDCGYFSSSSKNHVDDAARFAWRVELTPTRVQDGAVTFRLRWRRTQDPSESPVPVSEDIELTLRPGEFRAMDSVPVRADAKTFNGRPCKATAAYLRVEVTHAPHEEWERRVVATDMWLVERLPNGDERSQSLSFRSLPHRTIPFYFDTIVDGNVGLDLLGEIVARPEGGGMKVSLQTITRWGDPSLEDRYDANSSRWLKSVVHARPEEIVEVALPKLDEKAGPFANRTFSIRLRARRIR